jgi:hypothetical protein
MVSTEEYKNFAEVYLPEYRPDRTVPAAPCSLTASALGIDQVRLDWADCSDDEVEFVIERRSAASNYFMPVGAVAANTLGFIDAGLQPGTAYTYRVLSRNGQGSSLPSPEAPASTLPDARRSHPIRH